MNAVIERNIKPNTTNYSLTDDLLFKECLAMEKNREFLIYFLKVFTKLPDNIIRNNLTVSYESPLGKNMVFEKCMTGDIIVKFANYIVNIEMYKYLDKEGILKSTCYGMKLFSTQLKIGDKYSNLNNMMQINIVKNIKMKFSKKFKSTYELREINDYNELCDKFKIKYHRIDLLNELLYNSDDEVRWIKFINAKNYEERKIIAKGDQLMEKFNESVNEFILDDETRKEFARFRFENQMKLYGQDVKKEARKEYSREIAKSLLSMNMSQEDIKRVTGLSLKELQKL